MDRQTYPAQDFDQWVQTQRAERAVHDSRLDIIDRDVVAYYVDPTDPDNWLPSKLQPDDDVMVYGMPVRVIGPAEGRGNFAAAYVIPEDTAPTLSVFPLDQVTDRAPADQNEPQPWFPLIPPPPEPPPEGPL